MAESSLVLELQRKAIDKDVSASELLRFALIVATKLQIGEFRTWVKSELSGYTKTEVPEYRMVKGMVVATHALRGTMKLPFEDAAMEHRLAEMPLGSNVAELESYIQNKSGMHMFFPPNLQNLIHEHLPPAYQNPHVVISHTAFIGIIDTVRSTVLEWALKLETEGILGSGMTFSDEEKQRAAQSQAVHVYGNNYGPIGHGSGHAVNVGDFGMIYQNLKDAGVPQAERNELENILDEMKKAKPEEKKSWAQRGLDWVGRNAKNIGAIASVIRAWFSPHLRSGSE